MRRPPMGFTTIELLVALVITAVLGALIVPTIIAAVDRSRIDGARESIDAIAEAIDLFADQVNEYPATVTQLVVPITGADADICGAGYNGGEQNRWSGPYLDRALSAGGVPIGIGTVADAFTVLPDPSGIDWLRIEIQEVLPEDAAALDRRIDDGDGAVDGALRWTAAGDYVTARYLIPFPDC